MNLPTLLPALTALVVGIVLGAFWQRSRSQSALNKKEIELAGVRATLDKQKAVEQAQAQSLEAANQQFQEQMKVLAGDALRGSQKDFLNLAAEVFKGARKESSADLEKRQSAIAELVKPISENLEKTAKL